MPYIRVSCLSGALTAPQKATLAALLVDIVMGQEIEPVTEIGRAATPVFFDEIDARNWFPGGTLLVDHPEKIFFIVEAVVAASFFSQVRRDAVQTAVAKAFVEILGDDGSILEREGVRISPAYLMRFIPCSSRSLREVGGPEGEQSTRRRSGNSSAPLKAQNGLPRQRPSASR